jgi:quercetin dioxygenase-like cupin family protein
MSNRHAVVLTKEERPAALNVVGENITVLADAERTETFEIFLQAGPEGAGPPPHSHHWDEAFYVVRGSVDFILDGQQQTAMPGALVYIPGGTIHCFRIGRGGVEMLSINSHAGAAAMFTELDARIAPDAPDLAALVGIVTAHGLDVHVPETETAAV